MSESFLSARRLLALWTLLASAAAGASQAQAEEAPGAEKPADRKWVRVERDEQETPQTLQTAIVRFASADAAKPATVDLIGAIHVGDKAYYDALNEEFKGYDVLLFELVAPKGTKVPKGRGTSNAHPVGALQNGMKSMLELEHQLELIDYTAANFVHADMTPDELAKSMADRKDGFAQMFFRLMGQSLALQSKQQAAGKSTDFDILMALFDKNRAYKLKCVMAEQFEQMESLLVSFGGEEGTSLITERNKAALKVLEEQLAAGHKRIGIFYGAGHMVDMERRLVVDFGLQPGETRWLTAWSLTPPAAKPKPKPAKIPANR